MTTTIRQSTTNTTTGEGKNNLLGLTSFTTMAESLKVKNCLSISINS